MSDPPPPILTFVVHKGIPLYTSEPAKGGTEAKMVPKGALNGYDGAQRRHSWGTVTARRLAGGGTFVYFY